MTDDRVPSDDDLTPESYADLAALAKTLTDEDAHLDEPPADLWSRIESQTFSVGPPSLGDGGPTENEKKAIGTDELAQRRRRRRLPHGFLAAAAAAIVVVIVGALVIANDDDVTTVGDVALVNTDLDPRGAGSHGEARLVRLDDGSYALDIDVDRLPEESDAFFELWIIDTNVEGMVSLGPLHGNGRYGLPPSIDPTAFPVVDISIEPADGVPTHSGASILRGVLDT